MLKMYLFATDQLQRRGERRATINEVLFFISFVKEVRSVRCEVSEEVRKGSLRRST